LWCGLIVGFVVVGELQRDWTLSHVGRALAALLIARGPAIQIAFVIPLPDGFFLEATGGKP